VFFDGLWATQGGAAIFNGYQPLKMQGMGFFNILVNASRTIARRRG